MNATDPCDFTARPCSLGTSTTPLRSARAAADHLADLLSREHGAMADFLLALADFDEARGWAELGHASLFAFLVRQLHLSKSAAYHRAAAARLVREHAVVAEALRSGRLCLSSVAELAKVLTLENQAQVLPRFFGLSAREAREVVAELAPVPSPPRREVLRAAAPSIPSTAEVVLTSEPSPRATLREQVHSRPANPGTTMQTACIATSAEAAQAANGSPAVSPPAPSTVTPASTFPHPRPAACPAAAAVPLTADLRRLHVTVSRRFLEKVEAAKAARAHARPGASTEAVLEEALDLLLAREAKRREAATDRPRAPSRSAEPVCGQPGPGGDDQGVPTREVADPRRIPAHVRREVWARDQGRCAWPLDGGGTCGSTHRLQLDHVVPAARGGPPTAANLRILCERHNQEAARRVYGLRWMERFTSRPPAPLARGPRPPSAPPPGASGRTRASSPA